MDANKKYFFMTERKFFGADYNSTKNLPFLKKPTLTFNKHTISLQESITRLSV